MEYLDEHASLKRGLEFLLGRYFSPDASITRSF
jgi:hypothetical protein